MGNGGGGAKGVSVVLPVKSFAAAKQRLSSELSQTQRADLARHLAGRVAAVVNAGDAELWIACDDEIVRGWASSVGASVAWTPDLGLDGAVASGVREAIDHGAAHLIVAHADLARPSSLLTVAAAGVITVVPDRHHDGTNVISFPADAVVEPAYGRGSFRRHLASAQTVGERAGYRVRVLASPDLGLDVDTVYDVRHPAIRSELPVWLQTPPDNHSIRAG